MTSFAGSIAQWFWSVARAFRQLGSLQTESINHCSPLPARLRISSPCDGSCIRVAELGKRKIWEGQEDHHEALVDCIQWQGFCACCKRPLTITEDRSPPSAKRARSEESGPCAFVVAVWGTNAEYVLGAIVLGYSLRRVGTKHDLVLMHTSDVPKAAVSLLVRAGWKSHQIEYVKASGRLFNESCAGMRFEQVFTKLHVFSLTTYRKVVMLDADLLVKDNIDDLFDLTAPAALGRGPWSGYNHGEKIDCSYFFGGAQENTWSWGQASGINAGVMLLEPSEAIFKQCLAEVADRNHPEHIRGNGPEQDYLSRFFAGQWTHIDVAYNFQLHHMYFALSPKLKGSDRAKFMNRPDLIKVFHYSSDPKPWARHLNADYDNYTADAMVTEIKKEFRGYKAWVLKDLEAINMELVSRHGELGAALAPDGRIRQYCTAELGGLLGDIVEASENDIQGCEGITKLAVELWEQVYREISMALGERSLASVVIDAMTIGAVDVRPAGGAQVTKDSRIDSTSKTWKRQDGWWIQQPLVGRAIVTCSVFPQPHAVFKFGGTAEFTAIGEGVHIAAAAAAQHGAAFSECKTFALDCKVPDVVAWVSGLPAAAMVLLAAVDLRVSDAEALFPALVGAGLGCPSVAPPSAQRVMVAMGRKGKCNWQNTHAAPDVASVSGSL